MSNSRLYQSNRRHGGTSDAHVGLWADLISQRGDKGALNTDTPQNGHKGNYIGRLMGSHLHSLGIERSGRVFPKMGLVRGMKPLAGVVTVPGLAKCSRTGKRKAITSRY